MKTSDSIKTIGPAFLLAQKEIDSVIKTSTNPYFHSKYADLSSVIEACKEKLNKVGIVVLQPIDGELVETILIHVVSGEWFSSFTPIRCKVENDPQALGSAITYARRYALKSMLFIPDEDDDAEKATEHSTTIPTNSSQKSSNTGTIGDYPVTPAQMSLIKKLQSEGRIDEELDLTTLKFSSAKTLISDAIKK